MTLAEQVEEARQTLAEWAEMDRPLIHAGRGSILDIKEAFDALADRIVVQDLDGRTIKFDKVAEAEAALDEIERANARIYDRVEALRAGAHGHGIYVSVHRDAYAALLREAGIE